VDKLRQELKQAGDQVRDATAEAARANQALVGAQDRSEQHGLKRSDHFFSSLYD